MPLASHGKATTDGPMFDRDSRLIKTPATLQYVAKHTGKVTLRRDIAGMDSDMEGAIWEPKKVWIRNARGMSFSLNQNGFTLVPMQDAKRLDFFDSNNVLDEYYPECQTLLKNYYQSLGEFVQDVIAFDHNIRQQEQRTIEKTQEPIALAHGDYTTVSAPRRLELLAEPPRQNDVWKARLGDTPLISKDLAQDCLQGKRRYAFVNIWKSIDAEHPVQSMPLACMDKTTLGDHRDLRILELIYTDRVGENFLVSHNEGHTWWYFHEMTFSECLLIQQWDSVGSMEFCVHSAFEDPSTPSNAIPRSSIEVRCLVIWET